MKKDLILSIIQALGLTIAVNILIIIISLILQYVYNVLTYYIGFPYHFFYFDHARGFHGTNLKHFIYDGIIWYIISIIAVFIQYRRKKNRIKVDDEVIDTPFK